MSDPTGAPPPLKALPTQLIDCERVAEVIDLICEGEYAALNGWVDYLQTDLNKFEALLSGPDTAEKNKNIQSAAHSIKGTCLNLGAQALGDLFSEFERDAKEGKSQALNQRLADCRVLGAKSVQALREIAVNRSVGN